MITVFFRNILCICRSYVDHMISGIFLHGNPLPHSCLENSMDTGPCQVTVYGVAKVGHE